MDAEKVTLRAIMGSQYSVLRTLQPATGQLEIILLLSRLGYEYAKIR